MKTVIWAWSIGILLWTLPAQAQQVIAPSQTQPLSVPTVLSDLSEATVVYLGETHDRPADHEAQLEIIQALHQRQPQLAIAMEMFQQPYQSVVNRYLAGEITEAQLQQDSEFDRRWGFAWEYYAPILRYARVQELPVIALNVPTEVTRQVATDGLESLSDRDRQWIPPLSEIHTDNPDYRQWLQDIYSGHSNHGVSDGFETFLQAQVLWDETMAAGIAEFVQRHPGTQVVVLAGQGHILFGYGIPDRVQRRLGDRLVQRSVLLNPNPETRAEADVADYFWINQTNDCKNSSREI